MRVPSVLIQSSRYACTNVKVKMKRVPIYSMVHFKLALEWTVLLSKHFDYSHFFKSKCVFTAYKFVNGINGNDDE